MKLALFSNDFDTILYWQEQLEGDLKVIETVDDLSSLNDTIILADFDTVASDINRLIQDDKTPPYLCILERNPNIVSGKMMIRRGAKAYGNSRMLGVHLQQLCETVAKGKVWTYPELTAAITQDASQSKQPGEVLLGRLTEKEREVALLVLEGLTNDGIAHRMEISSRTVKAHMSAIFSKLHINDRLSLVLLLR